MKNCFYYMILSSFILLQSCGGGNDNSVQQTTNTLNNILYPTILKNESTEPNTVEVTLTAEETYFDYGTGIKTKVWAYNGVIPGPTIEAKIGDTVIVHLINKLPEATTIHYHGVELPANMDGSNISQIPVQPGESFTYKFIVNRAATYWYHPHARSNVQVELGLHGAFIVRDPEEDKQLNLPVKEHLILFDDIKLDESGQVAKEYSDIPAERAVELLNGREGNILLVNGQVNPKIRMKYGVPNRVRIINVSNSRFMRVSIFNQKIWQIGGDAGLLNQRIDRGEITEIFNPNFRVRDSEPEYYSDPNPELGIMLTPGERAEFIFTPNTDQDVITLDWHDIHRGKHDVRPKVATAALVIRPNHGTPTPPPVDVPPTTPAPSGFDIIHAYDGSEHNRPIATFEMYGAKVKNYVRPPLNLRPTYALNEGDVVGETIKIMYGHSQPDVNGDVTFFIKAKMAPNPDFDSNLPISATNLKMKLEQSFPFDRVTPKIADIVKPNETRIIEISNMTGGDHNFHLHGFMFQLLDTKFIYDDAPEKNITIPAAFIEDKDTVKIPARPGALGISRSVTRLIVRFNDTNREGAIYAEGKVPTADVSGGWVMHCHFLEHSAKGMMSYIQVVP